MITVAFDVDGTLVGGKDWPRLDIIITLCCLCSYCTVIVWSGGGVEYARMWGRRLDLPEGVLYLAKGSREVDICFDDQAVTLGTVNIRV